MKADLTELSKTLEHFVTPEWAIKAILQHESLPGIVVDPCCGFGVMADQASRAGYGTLAYDIHDWGYVRMTDQADFLADDQFKSMDFTIFMNPPFSKATQFVEKAFELGARKIVCFQRFAWFESRKRRAFWDKFPPQRIYVCADRASCWRADIPEHERSSGTPTAHAWFVWERGQAPGPILSRLYRPEGES